MRYNFVKKVSRDTVSMPVRYFKSIARHFFEKPLKRAKNNLQARKDVKKVVTYRRPISPWPVVQPAALETVSVKRNVRLSHDAMWTTQQISQITKRQMNSENDTWTPFIASNLILT